ncbi:hypothetical protein ADMFC3_26980 [Geovibrio sp. ADMFC3]
MKRIIILMLLCINTLAYAETWQCLEPVDIICEHEVDGVCADSDTYCKKAERELTRYSSGCDLGNVLSMINQEHCNLEVICSDEISIQGQCERGAGCFPGLYQDNCPSTYDVRATGETRDVDCSNYGQSGTLTLSKFDYGFFTGGGTLSLRGGEVTCQKYYSPRENTDCTSMLANGSRPAACYVDECADLANNPRCERIYDATQIGDEATILNTDCVWVTNPGTGGRICTDDPNEIAALTDDRRLYDVEVETYKCEATDVRTCENKEYKMVCPDGTETICQTEKTCLKQITETYTETIARPLVANRNFDVNKCTVEDGGCEQYKNNNQCVLVQSDSNPPVQIIGGTGNISTGQNSIIVTLGRIDDNSLRGNCTIFEFYYSINITNLERIHEAILKTVKWDDFVQIYVNDNLVYKGEGTRVEGHFPPETGSCWKPSTSWTRSPNVDVKQYLTEGVNNLLLRVSVEGGGEGYAFFEFPINTQETYYCYNDYNLLDSPSNCVQNSEPPLCTRWLEDIHDITKAVCTQSAFYMDCTETGSRLVCEDWEEEVICGDQVVTLPNVALESDNMTGFSESLGILGILDDINSIWSGEYEKCSYGYFVNGLGGVYCNNCTGEGGFLCFQQKPEQQKSYELNKKGLCHFLKTDCTNRIEMGFGSVCLEHTKKFCCYDSKLARVLVEQSYLQLGKSWDSGCNGLTLDDLNNLDFGAMDLSEIIDELENKIDVEATKLQDSVKDKIGNFYTDFSEQMDDRGAHPDTDNE